MAKPSLIIDGVGFLGKATILEDLPTEYSLALQRINVTVDQNSVMRAYSRIVMNREVIQTMAYTRVTKRNSYTDLLINGHVFEIKILIVVQVHNELKCFAIGRYFKK